LSAAFSALSRSISRIKALSASTLPLGLGLGPGGVCSGAAARQVTSFVDGDFTEGHELDRKWQVPPLENDPPLSAASALG